MTTPFQPPSTAKSAVGYDIVDSPVGRLLLTGDDQARRFGSLQPQPVRVAGELNLFDHGNDRLPRRPHETGQWMMAAKFRQACAHSSLDEALRRCDLRPLDFPA